MGHFFGAVSLATVVFSSRTHVRNRADCLHQDRTRRRKSSYDISNVRLYIPLDPNRSTTRVLLVNAGQPYEDIDCSLAEIDLNGNPEYTALSYTWGPPIRRSASLWTFRGMRQYLRERMEKPTESTIIADGHRFPVEPNLESALRHLRKPDEPLLLWVDAVCINQGNAQEKQHQVGLMTQIYTHAKQTIVWLGHETDGSDRAMDFIATSDSIDVMNPKFKIRDISPPWPDLQALFARSWWSRMWIIQEALLSKDIVVRCGHKEVPFANFAELALKENALRRRLRTDAVFGGSYKFTSRWTFVPPTTPFYTIFHIWRSLQDDPTLVFPLWETLVMSNHFSATLPRDKVYGLLGVCDSRDRANIEIDYTEDKKDAMIFKDTIAYIIKSRDHIQPLQFVSSGRKVLDIPSWVPDLSQTTFYAFSSFAAMGYNTSRQSTDWLKLNHPTLGSLVLEHPIFSSVIFFFSSTLLSRIATMLSDSRGAGASFTDDDSVLILRGIPFDTISYADPAPEMGIFQPSDAVYLDQERFMTLPGVVSALKRWEKEVAGHSQNPYSSSEGRYNAFWRTIIGNRMRSGEVGRNPGSYAIPPSSFNLGYELWMQRRPLPEGHKETSHVLLTMGTFQGMVGRCLSQRSFTITSRGFLGLSPDAARVGDLVCIFQGGDVPFVIRQKGDDDWELVGECYVHGIMEGEAVKDAKPEDVRLYRLR